MKRKKSGSGSYIHPDFSFNCDVLLPIIHRKFNIFIYIKMRTCYDSKSVKNKFLGAGLPQTQASQANSG